MDTMENRRDGASLRIETIQQFRPGHALLMRDPFWRLLMGSDITGRKSQSFLEGISFARQRMKWDLLYCGYDQVPRITREEFNQSIEKSIR